MAKRGVIVFLVLGILIFSSVVFVSAQEPGAGFSALDFVDAAISKEEITYTYSWGSFDHNLLDDLYYQCVGREIYYNGKGACDRFKVKDVYGRPADSTAASNQCFDICDYRHGMASILPNLILCEHVVAKAKENRLIDITTSTRGVYDIEHDLSSDFERNRKDDNSVTPGYAYNLVSSNYQNYLSQFPGAGEQDDMGRAAYFLAVIQKQDACNKELAKISEEELNSLYAEDEPTVGVPIPTDQKTSENGNYEKGGTLKEWKERLQSETGADSKQSKTAAACDALMKQKTAECSKHGGWKTDYMMEITDFRTDEHYEFQDIRNGGCPPTSPTGDTTYLDSQAEGGESAYQVVCSVLCSSWSCGEPKAETVGTKIGGIGNLKGKVEVMQPDDSWKEVKSGTDIHLNDNIRTGENGKAVIKLADDTLFTLGHDSQFTVGDSKTESKLDFGRLKAKIKCLINTVDCFPVRFTNAVASVRGTEYVATADQYSNKTTILVNEGTVSVTETKTGSTQDVSAGNSGVVDNSGIKVSLMPKSEWKNAAGEFDPGKNQWAIYLGVLGVLIAIGLLAYKKMKNKKDTKSIKKQSVEHKKPEKSSRETKKWGIAGLILAILSIVFIILPYFGIILAILAVVFAIIQKKCNQTKIATAGLIMGIMGIVLNIIMLIAVT